MIDNNFWRSIFKGFAQYQNINAVDCSWDSHEVEKCVQKYKRQCVKLTTDMQLFTFIPENNLCYSKAKYLYSARREKPKIN